MDDANGLASISEALDTIARLVHALEPVTLPLDQAIGLTLAAAIKTDMDYPPFDKAMMDGFAVRSADCQKDLTELQVAGEIAAGQMSQAKVNAGQAIRINTGAPMPPGADAVIPIEKIELSPDGCRIRIQMRPKSGASIASRANDVRAGQEVLPAGTRMGAAQIATAAAAGASEVLVHRRPRLGVLVTGDELVDVSMKPSGAQIRNSNGPCLVALAGQAGCEVVDLGIARDEPAFLKAKLTDGLKCDVLCVSGGVSMGQYDYVPQMLAEAGVRVHVQKIAMKPGKPSLFGIGPAGQAVFGLPGNPVSAYVCFVVFVRAALQALQGRPVGWPSMQQGAIDGELRAAGARAEWIPAVAIGDRNGVWRIKPTRWTGSGDVFGLGRGNALIYREAGAPACQTNDSVTFTMPDFLG